MRLSKMSASITRISFDRHSSCLSTLIFCDRKTSTYSAIGWGFGSGLVTTLRPGLVSRWLAAGGTRLHERGSGLGVFFCGCGLDEVTGRC
jgi:hypothetical protein